MSFDLLFLEQAANENTNNSPPIIIIFFKSFIDHILLYLFFIEKKAYFRYSLGYANTNAYFTTYW